MNSYYIGLDIHKRTISYCIKSVGGQIWAEGKFTSNRSELIRAQSQWPRPWIAGMEATIFSGWIHDVLKECGQQVRVGDPNMKEAPDRSHSVLEPSLRTCVAKSLRRLTWIRFGGPVALSHHRY